MDKLKSLYTTQIASVVCTAGELGIKGHHLRPSCDTIIGIHIYIYIVSTLSMHVPLGSLISSNFVVASISISRF